MNGTIMFGTKYLAARVKFKDAVKSVLCILSDQNKVCYCRLDRWNFI